MKKYSGHLYGAIDVFCKMARYYYDGAELDGCRGDGYSEECVVFVHTARCWYTRNPALQVIAGR